MAQRRRATLTREAQHSPEDRRSEASKVGRELIRETASLIGEQTTRYLQMPRLTREVLHEHEPIIDRLILISDPRLLTRPRVWVKELIKTLSAAMLVEITIVEHEKRQHLKVSGRWSDVQLAELTLQRIFIIATRAATYAYRAAYRESDGRSRRKVRGSRKRWLIHFVTYLRAGLGHIYERLAQEHGVDGLRAVVRNLEDAMIPAGDVDHARLKAGKAVAASGQ
jgi:hypothetical protein